MAETRQVSRNTLLSPDGDGPGDRLQTQTQAGMPKARGEHSIARCSDEQVCLLYANMNQMVT
jgi:hypothetical protein